LFDGFDPHLNKIFFFCFENLSQIDVFNFLIQFVEDQSFQIAFFLQQEIGINLQNKKTKTKNEIITVEAT
jgi:hypothetical protein